MVIFHSYVSLPAGSIQISVETKKKVSHHMLLTNHERLVCCSLPCDLSPTQHLLDDPFTVPGSPLQGSTDLASSYGTHDVHPIDYVASNPFFFNWGAI